MPRSPRPTRRPSAMTWAAVLAVVVVGSALAPARILSATTAGHGTQERGPPVVAPAPSPAVARELAHRLVTTALPGAAASPVGCCPYSTPNGLVTFDPVGRSFYIAYQPDLVEVVNQTNAWRGGPLTASIAVGNGPFDLAADTTTGNVYVTNTYSGNVTEISHGTYRSIASVDVQKHPKGIAFDATDGRLFVADSGTDRVTVLSVAPLRAIANISVGPFPVGVAWDSTTDEVFVADHGSGSVTVLNGTTLAVTANVSVGREPFGLAVDPATNDVYISDQGSNQVSVIAAATDRLLANIPVPLGRAIDLEGVAYDSYHHLMWVAGGVWYAVAISTHLEAVVAYVFIDPAGVAYDPYYGDVCMTNIANRTFACVEFGSVFFWATTAGPAAQTGIVTFLETGLPNGTRWTVRFLPANYTGNSTGMSLGPAIRFGVIDNYGYGRVPYSFHWTLGPVPGYTASRTSGNVTSRGGQVTVHVVFT